LYHSEVERLGKFLEGFGGRKPTSSDLLAVISQFEERRAQLRALVSQGSAQQTAEASARFYRDGTAGAEPAAAREMRQGVPLALVGGPLLPAQWPLFEAIESAGGQVVLTATEPGERHLLPPLPQVDFSREPLAALTNHYFDHLVDVFQRPNSRLYDWLGPRLQERRVRGLVLWVHVGCDLWRAEAASLREAFGLPVLVLDGPEAHGGGRRESHRLSAFIETLQCPPRPAN
jgi:benzoyl-CoA reductase/2-hydroxyglutaryl-CoA dehydratase subunit BcrC/BadD/HgdB